ncbi:hypothetical protein [Legionella quateirensis]|uniref:Flagellar FliJ protein n=1 Tax=Legionella quateirensis TaxID=45072 RepID=A0A378KRB8_9GAMM|nr:hypothetical protein [Legionella quateirensis]KTD51319.1 hypothetical protein Lqua_1546 [Legionella quateirensis]STY17434.1 Uncharacterised protein [Legionella quateirensis]
MSQTLTALMTRLTWQNNELSIHLQAAENESRIVMQQIQELEHLINQSCIASISINPDLEINKLNFLTQQQEKKEELLMILKNHQALEAKLKDKLLRIKTELKMLEHYMEREEQASRQQHIKSQENTLEEWVLQNRKSV